MRNKGFTIIEMMVSMVVFLLVVAITVAVITYQSRLAAYKIQATSAQQSVETALVLIRNDLMQAGGWVWPMPTTTSTSIDTLFIKYNGFLNIEAPSTPTDNCTKLRSVFCPPDCTNNKCGADWQIVGSGGSFTMDRFPNYIGYNSAFIGAINLRNTDSDDDCQTLLPASLASVVEAAASTNGYSHSLTFTPQSSFVTGSFASPAIVYQFLKETGKNTGTLLRNNREVLGGDISVTSLKWQKTSDYWSVIVEYHWKSRLPTPESVAIPSTQEIRVGIPRNYVLRLGG
ncbi:MAG: type II secretion system protein [Deltaproteobacteria bacterium]|nr:type II secretion system protein [Deltaproteobacteria bacterium]